MVGFFNSSSNKPGRFNKMTRLDYAPKLKIDVTLPLRHRDYDKFMKFTLPDLVFKHEKVGQIGIDSLKYIKQEWFRWRLYYPARGLQTFTKRSLSKNPIENGDEFAFGFTVRPTSCDVKSKSQLEKIADYFSIAFFSTMITETGKYNFAWMSLIHDVYKTDINNIDTDERDALSNLYDPSNKNRTSPDPVYKTVKYGKVLNDRTFVTSAINNVLGQLNLPVIVSSQQLRCVTGRCPNLPSKDQSPEQTAQWIVATQNSAGRLIRFNPNATNSTVTVILGNDNGLYAYQDHQHINKRAPSVYIDIPVQSPRFVQTAAELLGVQDHIESAVVRDTSSPGIHCLVLPTDESLVFLCKTSTAAAAAADTVQYICIDPATEKEGSEYLDGMFVCGTLNPALKRKYINMCERIIKRLDCSNSSSTSTMTMTMIDQFSGKLHPLGILCPANTIQFRSIATAPLLHQWCIRQFVSTSPPQGCGESSSLALVVWNSSPRFSSPVESFPLIVDGLQYSRFDGAYSLLGAIVLKANHELVLPNTARSPEIALQTLCEFMRLYCEAIKNAPQGQIAHVGFVIEMPPDEKDNIDVYPINIHHTHTFSVCYIRIEPNASRLTVIHKKPDSYFMSCADTFQYLQKNGNFQDWGDASLLQESIGIVDGGISPSLRHLVSTFTKTLFDKTDAIETPNPSLILLLAELFCVESSFLLRVLIEHATSITDEYFIDKLVDAPFISRVAYLTWLHHPTYIGSVIDIYVLNSALCSEFGVVANFFRSSSLKESWTYSPKDTCVHCRIEPEGYRKRVLCITNTHEGWLRERVYKETEASCA